MPLLWRVFLGNAVVILLATLVLALSPITVSSPPTVFEASVLAIGGLLIVGIDLVLLRQSLRPLNQLTGAMRQVDLLDDSARLEIAGTDPQVRAVSDAFNDMVGRLEAERRLSSTRAIEAQEAERLRISRELHDEIGQQLTGVLLRLGSLRDESPVVVEARRDLRRAMEEVRDISQRLRPPALDQLGLAGGLTALAVEVSRAGPLTVTPTVDARVGRLPDADEIVVYRVAQEALTNVARHARTDAATLTLRRDETGIELAVADAGAGFDPNASTGTRGLAGMRERALLAGGTLTIDSAPGAGTTVTLRLERP